MMRVDFTEDELKALAGLMDIAVKASGLSTIKTAYALLVKLENAQPVEEPDED